MLLKAAGSARVLERAQRGQVDEDVLELRHGVDRVCGRGGEQAAHGQQHSVAARRGPRAKQQVIYRVRG